MKERLTMFECKKCAIMGKCILFCESEVLPDKCPFGNNDVKWE